MKFNKAIIVTMIFALLGGALNITKDQTVYEYFNALRGKQDGTAAQTPPSNTPAQPAAGEVAATPTTGTPTPNATGVAQTVTPTALPANTAPAAPDAPKIVDLNDPNEQISDWLSISSSMLRNTDTFPSITTNDGSQHTLKFGVLDQLQNMKFDEAKKEGAKSENELWFRARGGYVYYSTTKDDINQLGTVYAKDAKDIKAPIDVYNATYHCFELDDYQNAQFTICSNDRKTKMKWLCSIQNYLKNTQDFECIPEDQRKAMAKVQNNQIQKKTVTQPVIIIPTPSKQCNDNWTYHKNGSDWECQCKDGQFQSPIDLPLRDDAILSDKTPDFQFNEFVSSKATFTSVEGLYSDKDPNVKLRYDRGAIRLYHPKLGKIVTDDGAMYQAEEIVFHTPAEHTIAGEKFEMEMQIISYGRTRGDIAKQAVWSFLFKKKPNHYNKFMWNLQFFQLPQPGEPTRDLIDEIYLPYIFQDYDDTGAAVMKKFSFYTYQGSLTNPPCTERTTHYVMAEPIPLSGTIIKLFEEALRMPDGEDKNGNIVVDSRPNYSNRSIQPTNNREVLIYDHVKFGCPDFTPKKVVTPSGHYEKKEVNVTQYKYVSGTKPSGLPNSFVVSENEAKGVDLPDIGMVTDPSSTNFLAGIAKLD
jgi:carbonic anhydrase